VLLLDGQVKVFSHGMTHAKCPGHEGKGEMTWLCGLQELLYGGFALGTAAATAWGLHITHWHTSAVTVRE
jgi:hypothetical protein